MLTWMTEEDWATVLELFRACRSRRGAKGRNDRIFLEALHDFAVHNIGTWAWLLAYVGANRSASLALASSMANASGSKPSPTHSTRSRYSGCAGSANTARRSS